MQAHKILKICLGLAFWCIAATLAIIEVIDLIDPTNSKMSDDGDPFGPPHIVTWQELVVVVPVIVLLTWAAFRLFNRALKDTNTYAHREEHKL